VIPEIETVKRKYPQYAEIPDDELASRLADRFPEAYGHLPAKVAGYDGPQSLLAGAGDRLARPEQYPGPTPEPSTLGTAVNRLSQTAKDGLNPITQVRGAISAFKNPQRVAAPIAGAMLGVKAALPAIIASGPYAPITALGSMALGATMGHQVNDHFFEEQAPTVLGQADRAAGQFAEAVVGGIPGALLPGALNLGRNARAAAAPKLRKIAEDRAVSSLGGTKQQNAVAMERHPNMGRTLLDQDSIPLLGTPERILTRVDARKAEAGQRVGQLIDDAHTELTRQSPPRAVVTPVGMPDLGPLGSNRPQSRAWRVQEVRAKKPTGKVVDSTEIANSLRADVRALQKVPGMESTVITLGKHLDTLAKNKTLTLPQAQALRQNIDKSINWKKRNPDMAESMDFLYDIRSRINGKMDEVISGLKGETSGVLKNTNRQYADLAMADEILTRNIPRGQTNRAISLTDTVAGAGAVAAGGGIPGALALGALNKFGRTYGDPLIARSANALAGKPRTPPTRRSTVREADPLLEATGVPSRMQYVDATGDVVPVLPPYRPGYSGTLAEERRRLRTATE